MTQSPHREPAKGRAMPQAARASRAAPQARSGLGHAATIAIANNLLDLIGQCEEAVEQNRLLDQAILVAVAPKASGARMEDVPQYTRSLDAALTLLPEGADWRRLTDRGMSAYASNPYNSQAQKRLDGFGATPALQLCSAALKVRLAPLEKAIATEARRAATGNTDAVHEGAGPKDIAQ